MRPHCGICSDHGLGEWAAEVADYSSIRIPLYKVVVLVSGSVVGVHLWGWSILKALAHCSCVTVEPLGCTTGAQLAPLCKASGEETMLLGPLVQQKEPSAYSGVAVALWRSQDSLRLHRWRPRVGVVHMPAVPGTVCHAYQ